ncbi:MAG: hypothetical protein WC767_01295 [Candidatus Paceibacterota bacterium]|jgi:hypothetical protein
MDTTRMEKGISNTKNIIIAAVILAVIIFAGYFYSTRDRSADTDLLVGVPVDGAVIDGDLLSTLRELKGLRLDEGIFQDPVFRSLVDKSRPLASQNSGRPNPFAPLESSAAFSSATSTR